MAAGRNPLFFNPDSGIHAITSDSKYLLSFTLDPPRSNAYFSDIYKMLVAYVDGDKSMVRTNHVTPYGYRIPFVLYFNSNKQLVPPPFDEGPQTLNK